jgi:precorrin-6B methylase 2
MSALEDDGWYGYRQHDYQPDLVFIDGPVRKVGGERAGIIKHCRNMVRNAKALVVDDTDDGDGLKLLGSLEELGWKFQVVNGPRRKFAIGEKSE